jgi:hypothetical protein
MLSVLFAEHEASEYRDKSTNLKNDETVCPMHKLHRRTCVELQLSAEAKGNTADESEDDEQAPMCPVHAV